MANIIIALSRPEEAEAIRNILMRNGFRSIFIVANGAQAISKMDDLDDGIVICGYKLQDMMYDKLKDSMPYGFDMVILVSQKNAGECNREDVEKLIMPLKSDALVYSLNRIADEQFRRRKRDRSKPRVRSEEDRKIIEEAKMLIMTRNHMTEQEAHKYIQRNSMESGSGLVETAEKILALLKNR